MIMVITIKNIPVLEGATAEDFVRNAEKNAVKVLHSCPWRPRNGYKRYWRNPVHSDSTNNGRDFFIRWLRHACLYREVREKCLPFTCGEDDLDDFFLHDADLYADELLGKTYCWVTTEFPHRIVALFTLANDSIKTKLISSNDKNRL